MSETKEMKEKIRKCKEKAINEGRSSTEASFGCLPVVPAVCVRCEKPIDEKIQWFMGFFMILLGASVLGLIPLSIGYLRSKNKK